MAPAPSPSQNCRPGALLAASAVVGSLEPCPAASPRWRGVRASARCCHPPSGAPRRGRIATRAAPSGGGGGRHLGRGGRRAGSGAADTDAARRSLHSVRAGDEGDSPSFVRELRGGTPWHGEERAETLPSPATAVLVARPGPRSFFRRGRHPRCGRRALVLWRGQHRLGRGDWRRQGNRRRAPGNASARARWRKTTRRRGAQWRRSRRPSACKRVGLQSQWPRDRRRMSSRCSRAHDAHAARPPPLCDPRCSHRGVHSLVPQARTSASRPPLHSEGGARVKGTPCATQIVEESVLYLCVWAEAANLRHMPELLCWLLHSLLGGRSAWTLGAVGGGSSLCASLLDDVIQPIYRVAAERMKAPSRLTSDDLNELFWSSRCECTRLCGRQRQRRQAEAHVGGACLATCPSMESNTWLHLAQTFLKPLAILPLRISSLPLRTQRARAPRSRAPRALLLALPLRNVSLAKELLDLWAHCALAVPPRRPASGRQQRQHASGGREAAGHAASPWRGSRRGEAAVCVSRGAARAARPRRWTAIPCPMASPARPHDRRIYAGCAGVVLPLG